MKGILLDTGNLANPFGNRKVGKTTVDNTPSERVVYPKTSTQYIVVQPNHMVVLTAYNLDDGGMVNIYKVLLSNGFPELGSRECCPTITSAESTMLARVNIPCYEMNPCYPVVVLDIPGIYAVQPVTEQVDLIITAVEHPLTQGGPNTECGGC